MNKITNSIFIERVRDLVGSDYVFIEKYNTMHRKITVKHNICNYEYMVSPANFLNGKSCPKCSNRIRLNLDIFKERVLSLVGNEFCVLGEFVNTRTPILIRHSICGYEVHMRPDNFFSGNRCAKCARIAKKSTDEFSCFVNGSTSGEYLLKSDYVGDGKKVVILHTECSKEYSVSPRDFISGSRCPYCSSSRGEKKIRDCLISKNIPHSEQYRIYECRNIRPLPFDFAIFDDANNLTMLIEYDGIQHFEERQWGNFKHTLVNDKIKNSYCETNDIELLRIPYWEYMNIEELIRERIIK